MPPPETTWQRARAMLHGFFRRHWQRMLVLRDRLWLSEEAFHLFLAAVVGVLGGLANLSYLLLNQLIEWSALGSAASPLAVVRSLPGWERVLTPALGGLVAGFILLLGLRLLGNPGLSNLLEVVVAGDGRLPLRPALLNAFASLVSISTGASIGKEGLITQLSATLASRLGQWAEWPPYRLRLLVACGAAAGISAGFRAPVAGAVFAAQIVLGNFSMNLFAPLVVSSVVAAIISRGFFGVVHWYEVPDFQFTRLSQLPWFLLLGLFSGVLGAGFLRLLRVSEDLFSRMRVALPYRLALAGLGVGLIALVYPEVWGNGYAATNEILHEVSPDVTFVLGLLAAKLLATLVTVGSGTPGGVFTPTLFLGAALGSSFGHLLHLAGLGQVLPTGAFALVGMGSALSATTHSPLLAIIMVFELSMNYSLMPPLMLACVISTLLAKRLHPESIYTEPLRRKGVQLDRESPRLGAATEQTVGDIMGAPVPPVFENTPFPEIADRFLTGSNNFLPVVDRDQRLLGMVALHDLKDYLNTGHELRGVIAGDIMRPVPPCLTPNQKLPDVLPVLLSSEARNVPVVNNLIQYRLLGAVARVEALGILSEAISARSTPKG